MRAIGAVRRLAARRRGVALGGKLAHGERRPRSPTSLDGTRVVVERNLKPEKVASVAAVTNGPRPERSRTSPRPRARTSARARSTGFALIVDYRGQKRFGMFRDEVRHAGCGVWLGKTYLMDADDDDDAETPAESLAAVGGVRLSPVVAAVVERAMPVREPGAPPPLVLDFALFATDEREP